MGNGAGWDDSCAATYLKYDRNHSLFTIHYPPTKALLHTFNSKYSRSHGLITSMKVSNSARLIAA